MGRRVLQVPGVVHSAPIPLAVRMGDTIWTSAIPGMDSATSMIPDDPSDQVRLAFENLDAVLAAGNADRDGVAHVTVFLADNAYREKLNDRWIEWYPDENDRPARHVIVGPLPQNVVVQLEVVARVDIGREYRG